jgi:IclR family pca regulon transcriptional regulator
MSPSGRECVGYDDGSKVRPGARRPRCGVMAESDLSAGEPIGIDCGENGERDSENFVQSLARGLSVIRAFGPNRGSMTLSEVAAQAEITRAGARRVLLTLQRLGYVAADGRQFRLTPKILDLGYSFLSSLDIWEFAQPVMERLVDAVHESCSASVIDGDDIVYVLRVPTRRIMSINLGIGTRLPAYATSMGRVLLAALNERELDDYLTRTTRPQLTAYTRTSADDLRAVIAHIRTCGWCLVDQELEEGLRSIAVPLTNNAGRVVAALNVSAHAARVSADEMVSAILPRLMEAQRQIDSGLPAAR